MKEILGKSIFEIDFSGLKASVIFWLVATYQVDIKEYDTIYINDLTSVITHSQPAAYVDDSQLHITFSVSDS